eukprot:TRINITY_DN2042_c1_g1_i1.p1 TRINITY_DN2042_c1_g1~~TRINITY_DN2042_c1_g1_i1.p1  ORF type:complete len:411 (+),score=118.25 TRINITY_DN2042_c1_g1_i1:180-1235(+)
MAEELRKSAQEYRDIMVQMEQTRRRTQKVVENVELHHNRTRELLLCHDGRIPGLKAGPLYQKDFFKKLRAPSEDWDPDARRSPAASPRPKCSPSRSGPRSPHRAEGVASPRQQQQQQEQGQYQQISVEMGVEAPISQAQSNHYEQPQSQQQELEAGVHLEQQQQQAQDAEGHGGAEQVAYTDRTGQQQAPPGSEGTPVDGWPGWYAVFSSDHQQYYYMDQNTGQSTWEHPSAVAQAPYVAPTDGEAQQQVLDMGDDANAQQHQADNIEYAHQEQSGNEADGDDADCVGTSPRAANPVPVTWTPGYHDDGGSVSCEFEDGGAGAVGRMAGTLPGSSVPGDDMPLDGVDVSMC